MGLPGAMGPDGKMGAQVCTPLHFFTSKKIIIQITLLVHFL